MRAGTAGELSGRALFAPALHPASLPIRRVPPSPCTQACPAGVEVKAYVSLIAEQRFAEALDVVRERCPLPGVCGRVCTHPCEAACLRGRVDEPVSIRALKRFVADLELDLPRRAVPRSAASGPSVAVIGAGPAGLTAAYDLRRAGLPVTVFEAEAEPGGMLRYGIAAYRLPREVLSAEIAALESAGVEIRTGIRLGVDVELDELSGRGYAAVLLTVGAQVGRKLGVPGEEGCRGVHDALSFLRRVHAGDLRPAGRHVLVVGGGSTAVEAARTARRLGAATVEVLYRRSPEEMLAGADEVEAAEAEGVRFRYLVAPARVLSERDRLTGLECRAVALGAPDAAGRREPIVIPHTEFALDADALLAAVGQKVDFGFLPSSVRAQACPNGLIAIDGAGSRTRLTRVFAAGDVVTGPATVVEAIAAGHRAAESIRAELTNGRPWSHRESALRPEYELPDGAPVRATRVRTRTILPAPGREFVEAEQAFTAAEAVAEARRCLRCGPCGECRICAPTCHRRHLSVRIPLDGATPPASLLRVPASFALTLSGRKPAEARLLPDSAASCELPAELFPVRVEVAAERCRGCAKCVEVCPFHAVALLCDGNGGLTARVDAAACRGCLLCTSVCATGAARAATLAPEWGGRTIADALGLPENGASRQVVLACAGRIDALEESLERAGVHAEVIRVRCAGQIEAGMLLELAAGGRAHVMVASCAPTRCRFGVGATLAAGQVARAQAMLKPLGSSAGTVVLHTDSAGASGGRPWIESLS